MTVALPVRGHTRRVDGPAADEIRARLRQVVQRFGSQKALARQLGMNEHLVSSWMTGTCLPGAAALRKIALRTGTSIDWLLLGRGDAPR